MKNFAEPNGTEDLVTAIFQTDSVAGTLNFNLNSIEKSDHMLITGTAGSVQFSVHGNSPITVKTKDNKYQIDSPNPSFIETPMIQEVVKYLSGHPAKPCFGKDALPTVLAIDNILEKFYGGRQRDFWKGQL
ncbi:hypothetical protein P4S72_29910 [Vibrio sp. PP-XX7]